MAKKLNSLSVFFPAFNDAQSIPILIKDVFKILPRMADQYEVIVVNDGSTDNTAKVLKRLSHTYSKLKIITHNYNQGYGGALKSGFRAAQFDYVFYTDGDGQYDPKELPALVEKMNEGIDLVNGYKIKRHDPWIRIIIGELYSLWVRLLLGIRLADVDCDFRLFNKKILEKINLQSNSGAICAEMLLQVQKNNGIITSVPVHHYPRIYGSSQFFHPMRIIRSIFEDLKLWFFEK